ncbi:MAG: PorP/SprF family type IX secretion system membrane protein [Saprospiraceae bacterium]|nr:PorP/SprF family type IX secretion system membrane protein [Saprospiraceae bacterium]MCC7507072.1 PorP/SprF family type IX secretion system membrane protein [Saprospiraceae bacterium]
MKKTTLRILSLSCALVLAVAVQAQDIHFSQFYMSPLNLNPAMTGVMNCNHRFVANYRNQWSSILKQNAYNTYSMSYDQKLPVGRYDYFGLGGTLWGDKAGTSEFATLQARLSGSYAKKMGGYRRKAHYLVLGGDLGVSQRSINSANLQWPSQNNGNGQYDPNFGTAEIIADPNFLFLDLSAGILWFSVFDEDNNFYFGGAFNHLNRANVSFGDASIPLYSKFTFHAGGEFMIAPKLGLIPGVVTFIQGPSFQVNGGTSFKFLLGNSRRYHQAFQLGAWARVSNKLEQGKLMDALIMSTRFDYEQFTIGFSYDINTSSLARATNGNGAFEFSLVYKICGPERRGVYCPNF